MRPRDASVRWVIGLTLTKACTQPGMVDSSTNTLLANVSGNSTVMLICMTLSGVCIFRPMIVHAHDRLNANTSSSATARSTPSGPPSGRKPRTTPSTTTTSDATE